MPYIAQRDREHAEFHPETPGELNYAITTMIWRYVKKHGVSYTVFNAVIGVLECAKLELYRRMVAPYEDKKKDENGDCYP